MNMWLSPYRQRIQWQRRLDWFVAIFGMIILLISFGLLISVILNLMTAGAGQLNSHFLFGFPSRFADQAGILPAWIGSSLVLLCTALICIPIGVGAAIYFEEYASKNWLSILLEINLYNLAGVPSIIYGLMGLSLLIYGLALGKTILVAGLVLALITLPMIVLTAREAIRAVPLALREAAYAIGCDRWQVIWKFVLPQAWASILTGVIAGLSRVIGEVAPLISLGVFSYVAFLPASPVQGQFPWLNMQWLQEPFNTLPLQIYNWLSRPQVEFHQNAAAAGLVLLMMTMFMNLLAAGIRSRLRRRLNHI